MGTRRQVGLPMPMPMSVSIRGRSLVAEMGLWVRGSVLLLLMGTRGEPQGAPVYPSGPISLRPRTILVGPSIQRSLVNSYRGSKPDSLCPSSSSNLARAQFRPYRPRTNSNALRRLNVWDRVISTCQQHLVFSLLSTEVKTPTRRINPPSRTAG